MLKPFGNVKYKTMSLEIEVIATAIMNRCHMFFKDPPPGLYYEGNLEAVLSPDDSYFTIEDGKIVLFRDFSTPPTQVIYVNTGGSTPKVVVGRRMIDNPTAWSTTPTMPYMAMWSIVHTLEDYICETTNRRSECDIIDVWDLLVEGSELVEIALLHGVPGMTPAEIRSWIEKINLNTKDVAALLSERILKYIRQSCSGLCMRVGAFIGPHLDNTYTVDFVHGCVYIHQGMDWRALEWERLKLEQELQLQE